MVPRPPRTFFQALSRPAKQKRAHHPDPFNPKTTKGWANALKVRFQEVQESQEGADRSRVPHPW